jgi:hypothetical protein
MNNTELRRGSGRQPLAGALRRSPARRWIIGALVGGAGLAAAIAAVPSASADSNPVPGVSVSVESATCDPATGRVDVLWRFTDAKPTRMSIVRIGGIGAFAALTDPAGAPSSAAGTVTLPGKPNGFDDGHVWIRQRVSGRTVQATFNYRLGRAEDDPALYGAFTDSDPLPGTCRRG